MKKELELKLANKIERLTNKTFNFDPRLKDGWYSSIYFLKTREIIKNELPNQNITMQFFQRSYDNAVLCGIDEAVALVHTFANNPEKIEIKALHDGDIIKKFEPVLQVSGQYEDFGFLEGVIDGILARRTSVATNVYEITKASKKHNLVFMGDRDDHYSNQQGDGYASYIGGMTAQATKAMNEWWGADGVGTMPHALIQQYNGDVLEACKAYHKHFPNDALTALVDYNNDVVGDSLKVANYFGEKLHGVRIDTSEYLIDKCLEKYNDPSLTGVNPTLVRELRKELDDNGHKNVKIIASGGFNVEKIKSFIEEDVPVDTYGIGSSLLKVIIGFTGDAVKLNGKEQAKVGRKFLDGKRLSLVTFEKGE